MGIKTIFSEIPLDELSLKALEREKKENGNKRDEIIGELEAEEREFNTLTLKPPKSITKGLAMAGTGLAGAMAIPLFLPLPSMFFGFAIMIYGIIYFDGATSRKATQKLLEDSVSKKGTELNELVDEGEKLDFAIAEKQTGQIFDYETFIKEHGEKIARKLMIKQYGPDVDFELLEINMLTHEYKMLKEKHGKEIAREQMTKKYDRKINFEFLEEKLLGL